MRIGLSCLDAGLGQTGGVQVYRRELLRALARHDTSDNQYTLLLGPGDDEPEIPSLPRFRAQRLAGPARPEPGWRRRLRRLAGLAGVSRFDSLAPQIDALALDAVHFPATRFDELALRSPVVLTFFDMQEEFLPALFPWRGRWARKLSHRAAVRKASVVIAPSAFTARSLERVYGAPAARLRVLPVGVADQFRPEPEPGERRRLLSRYGLPGEPFVFFPANPWPHKNHARLFAALRELRLDGAAPPLLVCCGRLAGEPRSAAELAVRAGFPRQRLLDLGFVAEQDMPALYRAARMLVFPSLFEGYGMPVAEALASGCPVACSNAASLPEVGAEAVRYFDPMREAEIGEAVRDVWPDVASRTRLTERGLERARALRWEGIVPRLLAVYREAASPGPSAGAGGSPSRRSNSAGSGSSGSSAQGESPRSSSAE